MDVGRQVSRCAIIMLILLLAGCAPLQQLPGAAATPVLPTLTFGLVGAASGPGNFEGSFTGNAVQLAIDTTNASGGIAWQGQHYHLTFAAANETDIVQDVRDLVFATPTPVAIIGPDESAPALAAIPIVQSEHIPMISIAMTTALTIPTKSQSVPLIFRARSADDTIARAITTYVAQHIATHGVSLATSDNDYGHNGMDVITRTLNGLNIPITSQTLIEPGTLDFAMQADQVVAAHSDTVICWSTEIEAATLLHDLHAAGWHGHFIVGMADADFIALAGVDGDGVVGATTWSPALTTAASQQFVQAYSQRFGSQPDEHAAAAYDAIQMLIAAIRAVGPDHLAIARYLATLTVYAGVQGPFAANNAASAYGASGDLTTALEIVQVQQGQQVLLATQS